MYNLEQIETFTTCSNINGEYLYNEIHSVIEDQMFII